MLPTFKYLNTKILKSNLVPAFRSLAKRIPNVIDMIFIFELK